MEMGRGPGDAGVEPSFGQVEEPAGRLGGGLDGCLHLPRGQPFALAGPVDRWRDLLAHTDAETGSPSRAERARSTEQEMQVKIGVSDWVNELDSVKRSSCTRSRNSAGSSASKLTTNSWS